MAVKTNLKNHILAADYAKELGMSSTMLYRYRDKGVIPAEAFQKSGKHVYVHPVKAANGLKSAPVPARGPIPAWAVKVGNKAMVKALKDGRVMRGEKAAVAEAA